MTTERLNPKRVAERSRCRKSREAVVTDKLRKAVVTANIRVALTGYAAAPLPPLGKIIKIH